MAPRPLPWTSAYLLALAVVAEHAADEPDEMKGERRIVVRDGTVDRNVQRAVVKRSVGPEGIPASLAAQRCSHRLTGLGDNRLSGYEPRAKFTARRGAQYLATKVSRLLRKR